MLRAVPQCMLLLLAAVALSAVPAPAAAQSGSVVPAEASPDARKLFAEAAEMQRDGQNSSAIVNYLEANKLDGGRCFECIHRAYMLAIQTEDFKTARAAVDEGLAATPSDADRGLMHYWLGVAWQREGTREQNGKDLEESCTEFKTALSIDPSLTPAYFSYGISLARLHRDREARKQFNAFLTRDKDLPSLHPRAERFVEDVSLARARMAPDFSITTLEGQRFSLDSLAGKVVLIDFWATWCAPCVAELPDLRNIVQEFQGQPFVLLSVSMDEDTAKWKKFVVAQHMTWPQFHDGDSGVSLANLFGVHKIPFTFSINAEGVVEDQHLGGNAQLDAKLKQLVAQAVERQQRGSRR